MVGRRQRVEWTVVQTRRVDGGFTSIVTQPVLCAHVSCSSLEESMGGVEKQTRPGHDWGGGNES